ncbi:MAG: hypothetical protein AAF170_19965, partial [Bacteroidota bacterium]
MAWTDLLHDPRTVTGLYGCAPSLLGFKLETIGLGELHMSGGVVLSGDLRALPDPMPVRWLRQGKSRAFAALYLHDLSVSEVFGIPLLHPNGHFGFEGKPVDIRIE